MKCMRTFVTVVFSVGFLCLLALVGSQLVCIGATEINRLSKRATLWNTAAIVSALMFVTGIGWALCRLR